MPGDRWGRSEGARARPACTKRGERLDRTLTDGGLAKVSVIEWLPSSDFLLRIPLTDLTVANSSMLVMKMLRK